MEYRNLLRPTFYLKQFAIDFFYFDFEGNFTLLYFVNAMLISNQFLEVWRATEIRNREQ